MSNDRANFGLSDVYNSIQDDPDLKQAEQEMREAGFNDCYLHYSTVGDQNTKLIVGKELTCFKMPELFSLFGAKANQHTADYLKLTKASLPIVGDLSVGIREARKNGITQAYTVDLTKKKM
jgi:hypothetical protein